MSSHEGALIQMQRVQIRSTLAGIVPSEELDHIVNKNLEKVLVDRAQSSLQQLSWGGSIRSNAIATTLASLRTLMFHLEDQAAVERANLLMIEGKKEEED